MRRENCITSRVVVTAATLVCLAPSFPIYCVDTRFASGKSALAIPFELDDPSINNHIFMHVSINGSPPLSFVLDTGASHTVMALRRAESLGLNLQQVGKVTGGIGAELPDVYLVTDEVSLSMPGVVFSSRTLVAVPLDKTQECIGGAGDRGPALAAPSGERVKRGPRRVVDGILGADFFSSFVVEIDYASRLINLYDPQRYKYSGKGKSVPIEIDPQNIFVRAQVKAPRRPPVMARLVVDTGSGTPLSLLKQFAEAHQLLPPARELTSTTDCGIGGSTKEPAFLGRLEALQLGGFKVSNLPTVFYQVPPAQGDGLLGNAVLRNFKVVFDYSRSRMILEPPR